MRANAGPFNATSASGCGPAAAVGCFAMFGLAALVIPFALVTYGVHEAVMQDREIRAARPVAATVVSSRVGESRGRRGRRNRQAIVVYRYEVDGRTYESDTLMLYAKRGRPPGVGAGEFVDAHPPGKTITAWYVPHDPSRSFIVRRYNEAAYVSIFLGLGVFALVSAGGVGYAFLPDRRKAAAEPGWQPLAAPRPLRARVVVNLVQATLYLSVWGWAAWHYFTHMPRPLEAPTLAYGGTAALGLPGLWYLFSAARAHLMRRAVSDARVAVRPETLRPGGDAEVRVEQELRSGAMLERVRVGLVCTKTTGRGKHSHTTNHWETWATPPASATAHRGRAGGRVTFAQSLHLPTDVPPTKTGDDPRYTWMLLVETALAGCPDYRETFDVRVHAPDEAR